MTARLGLGPLCAVATVGLLAAGAAPGQSDADGSYVTYNGNPYLPIVQVVAGDFAMGTTTVVRIDAGLQFESGYAMLVVQQNVDNLSDVCTLSGFAGDLYVTATRPCAVVFVGQLLDGLDAGSSAELSFDVPSDPELAGLEVGVQGCVYTEILTNATLTQYTVGVLH